MSADRVLGRRLKDDASYRLHQTAELLRIKGMIATALRREGQRLPSVGNDSFMCGYYQGALEACYNALDALLAEDTKVKEPGDRGSNGSLGGQKS